MKRRALILGIGGQDGSYIADILLERGYEVHGLYRRSSGGNLRRIAHILDRVTLHQGDMADSSSIARAVADCNPHEVYNEADQDSVGWSHIAPNYTYDITFAAVARLLEILRNHGHTRLFQPVSAMMFGDAAHLTDDGFPDRQNEETPLRPMSPYGVAKAAVFHLCRYYRERHGMFISCGILYNHDSPRRTEEYLLHKICKAAVRIANGKQDTLALGNLDAQVDIGYAREYMESAHAMLQLDMPDDFVIATGTPYTVGEIAIGTLRRVGIQIPGAEGLITVDPRFYKTGVKGVLCGDYSKATRTFGFRPTWDVWRLIDLLLEHAKAEN